jgi:hypothetical protein
MNLQEALDLAVNLLRKGKHDDSAKVLDEILVQDRKNPLALYLLGSIALDRNSYGTAQVLLDRAVKADPSAEWAWHNLGIAYKASQNMTKAEQCYRKALMLDPNRGDTLAMMAGCFVNAGNPEKAVEWADKSLALDPECSHAWNHKALALLELEKWEDGWDAWERRWLVPERQAMARTYNCPKWTGKPLNGVLVVHGEQGLGDEILYMTCFEDLKRAVGPDCDIVIESASRLVSLFRRSFGVRVYGTEQEVKANEKPDAWISMGSLPAMYRRSDESFKHRQERFLRADPARVLYYRDMLHEMSDGPHIGLAWWGGLAKTHSRVRNAPLKLWKEMVGGNEQFISVQYNTGDTQEEADTIGVKHMPSAVRDFDELTALIDACDMIISVCQTAHHTSGGLGKECWTLVPSAPAWRYGPEVKNVWYPSVKQYHQKKDDWETVFNNVRNDLANHGKLPAAKRSAA